MPHSLKAVQQNWEALSSEWHNRYYLARLTKEVARSEKPNPASKPIVFFIASARIYGLSHNAAFSLLTSWGLRLSGVPVHYFVCHKGMSRCVLGTRRDHLQDPPPCKACIAQSKRMFARSVIKWFEFRPNADLARALQSLSVEELSQFSYPLFGDPHSEDGVNIPLGKLVLPSVRWTLRMHDLADDETTRALMCEYIKSAYQVATEFHQYLCETQPALAVIFNGIMFPEATARWVAMQQGIRVITHEVGFQPFSAFFTEGQATAYPIDIPDGFELSDEQNQRLDAYLEHRFQGNFTMAGIRFWPEMRRLDEHLLARIGQHKQLVSIFTNVVYDTSQVHANTLFPHMFAWLEAIKDVLQNHTETLFVIRAHPDEMRPGTAKQSRQSVRDWIYAHRLNQCENIVFIDSQEYLSSYELIQRSKFVMVYNSSIGLEATLLRKPVLCAGKARYTQYPTVFFPQTQSAYLDTLQDFLITDYLEMPEEFVRNARKFLYFQLFRNSISFADYLEEFPRKGFVKLRNIHVEDLTAEKSALIRELVNQFSALAYETPQVSHPPRTLTLPENLAPILAQGG